MDYIKGCTFGFCTPRGGFLGTGAKESLLAMKERTGATHVLFAICAFQDTAQSVVVNYDGEHIVSDDELIDMIDYAKSIGLRPILKPLVNCFDGTWRAHINFFDTDVPCEPKWHEWFESYTKFQVHYAKIAKATGCEMVIIGCEMVQAARKSDHWRNVVSEVRKHFDGLISYNADKYQEANVTWWDAVDVISSSGYYPIDDWDNQLSRIEAVVSEFDKPFFFAEAGCMSIEGSEYVPNDWSLPGTVSQEVQASYYKKMFEKVSEKNFIQGFGLWDWRTILYDQKASECDKGYDVYLKKAEQIIHNFYTK